MKKRDMLFYGAGGGTLAMEIVKYSLGIYCWCDLAPISLALIVIGATAMGRLNNKKKQGY